jgi:hypothetical protein
MLVASSDRAQIRADGDDLAFVRVRATDAAGILSPRATDTRVSTVGARDRGGGVLTRVVVAPGHRCPTDNRTLQVSERARWVRHWISSGQLTEWHAECFHVAT